MPLIENLQVSFIRTQAGKDTAELLKPACCVKKVMLYYLQEKGLVKFHLHPTVHYFKNSIRKQHVETLPEKKSTIIPTSLESSKHQLPAKLS